MSERYSQADLFSFESAPQAPSVAAAAQLSPSFPKRAAWGTSGSLRAWQEQALNDYLAREPRDYLAVATPGAGKTTFALRIATELLSRGTVRRITVVAPTEHLKHQWAAAAARVGVNLDPNFSNAQGRHSPQFIGVVVTYAQVAANPLLHEARTEAAPTLVILDEVHHAGDSLSWGDAIGEAFEPARRRLSLTGTPFRSDTAAIPFVQYAPDKDGIRRSAADYTYGYGEALRDHVVRPVMFLSYSGHMSWRTRAGEEMSAQLGADATKDITAQAWRTALDPEGDWISQVLRAADQRLTEVRKTVPDAGAMIIATDQTDARAYARLLKEITGKRPTVVLSDEAGASERIDEYSKGTSRWLVAVRMVSEGVDVPRLSVGVYATSSATALFFAQAIGRFVRSRRRGETASIFLPSVPRLLHLAANLEAERDHALDRPTSGSQEDLSEAEMRDANRAEAASNTTGQEEFEFQALAAEASFDRVLFDGGEFGTQHLVDADLESEFLLIPGLMEHEALPQALRSASGEGRGAGVAPVVFDPKLHAQLRKELASLVGAWARRSGQTHATVHSKLRNTCGGPEVPQATNEQLQARIDTVRNWFIGR